jgi:CarD family transcriptional regulator
MIVKMNKYTLVLYRKAQEEFLNRLQELGVVDITTTGWEPNEAEREVLGEIAKYYDVEFPYGNLRLMVPMANTEQLGIRDVMSADKIPQVIEHIKKADGENMNQNWNKRQRENLEKIRSGNIFEVAEVYKFLYLRDTARALSTGEKKMLTNAKHILFSELVLACGGEFEEIEAMVLEAVNSSSK